MRVTTLFSVLSLMNFCVSLTPDPSSVESDALLMLALCLRSTPLPSSPSSPSSAPSLRCQTLSSLHLATCQSPKGKEGEQLQKRMGKNESRAAAALRLEPAQVIYDLNGLVDNFLVQKMSRIVLNIVLLLTFGHPVCHTQVEGCAARMETLLLQKTTKPKTHLPHHSTSSPTTPPLSFSSSAHSPPPQVSNNPNPTASPFKVTSSSTPKKEKDQQSGKISPKGEQVTNLVNSSTRLLTHQFLFSSGHEFTTGAELNRK